MFKKLFLKIPEKKIFEAEDMGLNIVATVSDQGASNVGAVRILRERTDIKYGRLVIEKKM